MKLFNPFSKPPVPTQPLTITIPKDAESEYELGWRHASGRGAARDLVQAYKWLTIAAGHGHEQARDMKNTIAERMTASELSEAECQVRQRAPSAGLAVN